MPQRRRRWAGDSALLAPGDSFSLLCTIDSEAITVTGSSEGAEPAAGGDACDAPAAHARAPRAAGPTSEGGGGAARPLARSPPRAQPQEGRQPQQQRHRQQHPQQPPQAREQATRQQEREEGQQQQQQQEQLQPPPQAEPLQRQVQQTTPSGPVGVDSLPPPVVLVLVGVPGSGKSTLAAALLQRRPGCWRRVNQDTVSGGKRGSRQQCVRAATRALSDGVSCIIDRCNVDPPQRADFLQVAASAGRPAHALVLQLPSKVCAQRAAERTDHEGGVQGASSRRVVYAQNSALLKAGPPTAQEGFTSVMVCTSEGDVGEALAAWAAHGCGSGADPVALWEASAPGRRQLQAGVPIRGHGRIPPPAPAATAAAAPGPAGAAASAKRGRGGAAAAAGAGASGGGAGGSGEPPPKRRHAGEGGGGAGGGAAAGSSRGGGGGEVEGAGVPGGAPTEGAAGAGGAKAPAGTNAFAVLMAGARAQGGAGAPAAAARSGAKSGSGRGAGAAGGGADGGASGAGVGAVGSSGGAQGGGSHWSSVLVQVAQHPHTLSDTQTIVHTDPLVVVMADGFPKARHHALVVAREAGLDTLSQLTRAHLPLLTHMRALGLAWALRAAGGGAGGATADPPSPPAGAPAAAALAEAEGAVPEGWQLGFHSVPSMRQLHMHVISRDFDSPCLKTKRHWNSFTTAFFRHADDVASELRARGRVDVQTGPAEQLLKAPLRCHRCGAPLGNMPQLKQHITGCGTASRE